MKAITCAAISLVALLLTGCATVREEELSRRIQTPISPSEVRVYQEESGLTDSCRKIAELSAHVWHCTDQGREEALWKLREKACRLGANGIIIRHIQVDSGISVPLIPHLSWPPVQKPRLTWGTRIRATAILLSETRTAED